MVWNADRLRWRGELGYKKLRSCYFAKKGK